MKTIRNIFALLLLPFAVLAWAGAIYIAVGVAAVEGMTALIKKEGA